MSQLSAAQITALNGAIPRVVTAGLDLGDLIDQILTDLTNGPFAVDADAADIDSVALGGCFSQDADTTTGLTFGYGAGSFHNGLALVAVGAGTVVLNASNTNYVEVDRSGTVSSNTTAFTSGKMPLYQIITGISTISVVTNKKPVLTLIGTAGTTGAMQSTEGRTKRILVDLGTISATTSFRIPLGSLAGTLAAAPVLVTTTVTADDTNYWTFDLMNLGTAGSGTTAMLAATNPNTTKATGGTGLTADVLRAQTLHGTAGNLDVVANSVLKYTATKAASAANLVNAKLLLEFTYSG